MSAKKAAAKPAKKAAPAKAGKTAKTGKKPQPKAKPKPPAKKAKVAKAATGAKAKPAVKKPAKPAAKPAAKRAAAAPASGTLRARVVVYPRREILDPQGKAIRTALAGIGFDQVEEVRAGKSFEIALNAKAARGAGAAGVEAKARELLTAMCEKLLANPVVEDYAIELPGEEGGAPGGQGGGPA